MRHGPFLILALLATLAFTPCISLAQPAPGGAPPDEAAASTTTAPVPTPAAVAQPGSGAPEVQPAVPIAASTTVPAPSAQPEDVPSTDQVLKEGKEAAEEVIDASKAGGWLLWAAALAAIFKLLLSAARKWGGILLNKQYLVLATMGLGLGVFLFSEFAAGVPTWQAVLLAASGPGSMVADALINLFLPEKWRAAAVKAEQKASAGV